MLIIVLVNVVDQMSLERFQRLICSIVCNAMFVAIAVVLENSDSCCYENVCCHCSGTGKQWQLLLWDCLLPLQWYVKTMTAVAMRMFRIDRQYSIIGIMHRALGRWARFAIPSPTRCLWSRYRQLRYQDSYYFITSDKHIFYVWRSFKCIIAEESVNMLPV